MFRQAEERGLLGDLRHLGIMHRVSLYANDVIIFAQPRLDDLAVVREILGCFGQASALVVNFLKSVAIPIRCTEQVLLAVTPALGCPIGEFPCKYLGLTLSLSKLQKMDVQPLIDKLARKLSFWKARLLSKEGRASFVQAVMTSTVIYQLIALDVDPWVLQLIDKLRRGFLWVGQEDAHGGNCLVA
jgi:hypothetical protein